MAYTHILRKQKKVDLCEFEAILICTGSFETAEAIHRERPCFKKETKKEDERMQQYNGKSDLEALILHKNKIRDIVNKTEKIGTLR